MRQHLVFVKLGGSLITDKAKPMTYRKSQVERIANELEGVVRQSKNLHFVLGTGAGSFGHFSAHEYGLRGGAQTAEQLYGMCITHNAVQRLSNLVAEELTHKNIPAFAVSPSGLLTCDDTRLVSTNLEPLSKMLEKNLVPVVHGDTIIDVSRGTTILSTEAVFQVCLQHLRPMYENITVIYLLNVDGLLDKHNEVVPLLNPGDDVVIGNTLKHDVTGGIMGKIKSARTASRYADSVYLVNGNTPGAITQAIAGKSVGTKVIS